MYDHNMNRMTAQVWNGRPAPETPPEGIITSVPTTAELLAKTEKRGGIR